MWSQVWPESFIDVLTRRRRGTQEKIRCHLEPKMVLQSDAIEGNGSFENSGFERFFMEPEMVP